MEQESTKSFGNRTASIKAYDGYYFFNGWIGILE